MLRIDNLLQSLSNKIKKDCFSKLSCPYWGWVATDLENICNWKQASLCDKYHVHPKGGMLSKIWLIKY